MRRLQIGVASSWRTARSQRRGIQRDHSGEQGPCVNRLLGFLVRTMPGGGASRGANRSGPRRACGRAEGRYRTLSRACSAIQRPQHSQFRGVFARSASISAGGPGRRKHHGGLAYTRGMTERRGCGVIVGNSRTIKNYRQLHSRLNKAQSLVPIPEFRFGRFSEDSRRRRSTPAAHPFLTDQVSARGRRLRGRRGYRSLRVRRPRRGQSVGSTTAKRPR
jgi:hypothetical protein